MLQVVLDVLVFDMDPQEAVAAPRFHHQWQPDRLMLEPGFPRDVVQALEGRGHTVSFLDGFSCAQAILVDGDVLVGGSDPRYDGAAVGW